MTNEKRREVAAKVRETMGALGQVELDGIPLADLIEPSEADEWVDGLGGLGAVQAMCDALRDMLGWVRRSAGIGEDECVDYDELLCILDRRLMPEGCEWPRFEDGEPVRVGDEAVDEAGEFVCRVSEIAFSDAYGTCLRYEDQMDSNSYNFIDGLEPGKRVRRPEPKVPDADGVEIRVGDTVWTTNGLGPFEVTRIVNADQLRVICDDEENGHLNVYPQGLTHRAPVLAADGKPLCEGETVYYIDSIKMLRGESRTVESLETVSDGTWVWFSNGSHGLPEQLTHERPDSWELLEDDATKPPCAYCVEHDLDDDSLPTNEKFARDLVRRAKSLAERGK